LPGTKSKTDELSESGRDPAFLGHDYGHGIEDQRRMPLVFHRPLSDRAYFVYIWNSQIPAA
jgi:hypothetical protein